MSSYSDLEMKVVQWGEARGIVQNGQPSGQAKKTVEEASELLEATAKLNIALRVDVRGLGVVEKPAQAVALLFMAIKSFDNVSQAEVMAALQAIMARSEVVAQEAHLWNPKTDCTKTTP